MIDNMEGQITFADLGIWSGKMSPEPSPVTKERTSRQSSRKSSGLQTQKLPMFLCLKRGSGHTADVSWEKANPGSLFPWYGVNMTPNTGAFLRGENVCVCADFNGLTAGEILFSPELRRETEGTDADQTVRHSGEECGQPVRTLPEGLPGDPEPGGEKRQKTSGSIGSGIESAISAITIDPRQQSMVTQEELAATIGANAYKEPQAVFCLQGNGINRSDGAGCAGRGWREDVSYTLNTVDLPAVFDGSRRHAYQPFGNVCETVQAHYGTCGGNQPIVVGLKREENTTTAVFDARGNGNGETAPTLTGDHQNRVTDYTAIACQKLVRRLTPKECERLQMMPDGWTDIGVWVDEKGRKRQPSDSPRYKAIGNSIALPFWAWLMKRISAQYERPATLGSLFDGVGMFPLAWARCNGADSCRWVSEIEDFPIAVSKRHFGDEDEGTEGDIQKYL